MEIGKPFFATTNLEQTFCARLLDSFYDLKAFILEKSWEYGEMDVCFVNSSQSGS